ncbi:ALA-interacting subunit 3 [Phytophthora nicotianae]|uniref:ALA-interacting subunit 3 n=1 Tax=Phytophthora nicotianae TaxID=4792 RepID=A0A0W8DFN0_PHYNI|nr:ALA-interacting subunit 3 [Phytophthora nicotianae]
MARQSEEILGTQSVCPRFQTQADRSFGVQSVNPRVSVQTEHAAPLSKEDIDGFLQLLVEFQAENCLADSFIGKDSTVRLIEQLEPRLVEHIPSRRTLGGQLLNTHADQLIKGESDEVKGLQLRSGGRANFLSDGWQDVGKRHLLGAHIGLFGSFTTLGLFPTETQRLDGLALASRMEKIMEDAEEDGWEIGGVITDDAGNCGRARRILALRWPKVVFLKCFAHDLNNLVKKILSLECFRKVSKQAHDVVNFLNGSSEKWLPLVQQIMEEVYGSKWQFKTFCVTRWNSMQGCFASLLRVKTAMRMFAAKYWDDREFKPILKVLADETFWKSLKDAERVINPICFASFKLQSDENTLADVVIVFRDLFDKYRELSGYDGLSDLVEVRWAACEHPLFMLALYLHPAYYQDASKLKATKISGYESIGEIAEHYYKRLVGGDPGTITGELDDWLSGTYMRNSPKKLEDFETSSLPNVAAFWRHWKQKYPRHCLPKLALAVLSVTVNTATCERYFSELALIQTEPRNRMGVEKNRKIAAVRKHLRKKKSEMVQVKPPAKRLVSPVERERLSAFSTPERRSSSSRSATSMPSASVIATACDDDNDDDEDTVEDVVRHWEQRFSRMADEVDPDAVLPEPNNHETCQTIADTNGGNELQEENPHENDTHEAVEEEEPPIPERLPFPDEDDKTFPQESILRGLRGRKVLLKDLCTKVSAARRLNFKYM